MLPLGTIVRTGLFEDHNMVLVGYGSPREQCAYLAAPIPAGQVLNPETDEFLHTFRLEESDILGVVFLGWTEVGGSISVDPSRSLLPLGTVVDIRGEQGIAKRVLIALYLPLDGQDRTRDYLGYMWPEGYRGGEGTGICFDAEDINQVLFLGYVDAGVQKYCASLPLFAKGKRIPMPFLKTRKLFGKKLELSDE